MEKYHLNLETLIEHNSLISYPNQTKFRWKLHRKMPGAWMDTQMDETRFISIRTKWIRIMVVLDSILITFLENVRGLGGVFYTDSSSPQSIEWNWVKRLRELRTLEIWEFENLREKWELLWDFLQMISSPCEWRGIMNI